MELQLDTAIGSDSTGLGASPFVDEKFGTLSRVGGEGRVLREGWLEKKCLTVGQLGSLLKRKYFCRLTEIRLSFFSKEESKSPDDGIETANIQSIRAVKDCSLEIVTKAKSYSLTADHPTKRDDWVESIRDSMQIINRRLFVNSTSSKRDSTSATASAKPKMNKENSMPSQDSFDDSVFVEPSEVDKSGSTDGKNQKLKTGLKLGIKGLSVPKLSKTKVTSQWPEKNGKKSSSGEETIQESKDGPFYEPAWDSTIESNTVNKNSLTTATTSDSPAASTSPIEAYDYAQVVQKKWDPPETDSNFTSAQDFSQNETSEYAEPYELYIKPPERSASKTAEASGIANIVEGERASRGMEAGQRYPTTTVNSVNLLQKKLSSDKDNDKLSGDQLSSCQGNNFQMEISEGGNVYEEIKAGFNTAELASKPLKPQHSSTPVVPGTIWYEEPSRVSTVNLTSGSNELETTPEIDAQATNNSAQSVEKKISLIVQQGMGTEVGQRAASVNYAAVQKKESTAKQWNSDATDNRQASEAGDDSSNSHGKDRDRLNESMERNVEATDAVKCEIESGKLSNSADCEARFSTNGYMTRSELMEMSVKPPDTFCGGDFEDSKPSIGTFFGVLRPGSGRFSEEFDGRTSTGAVSKAAAANDTPQLEIAAVRAAENFIDSSQMETVGQKKIADGTSETGRSNTRPPVPAPRLSRESNRLNSSTSFSQTTLVNNVDQEFEPATTRESVTSSKLATTPKPITSPKPVTSPKPMISTKFAVPSRTPSITSTASLTVEAYIESSAEDIYDYPKPVGCEILNETFVQEPDSFPPVDLALIANKRPPSHIPPDPFERSSQLARREETGAQPIKSNTDQSVIDANIKSNYISSVPSNSSQRQELENEYSHGIVKGDFNPCYINYSGKNSGITTEGCGTASQDNVKPISHQSVTDNGVIASGTDKILETSGKNLHSQSGEENLENSSEKTMAAPYPADRVESETSLRASGATVPSEAASATTPLLSQKVEQEKKGFDDEILRHKKVQASETLSEIKSMLLEQHGTTNPVDGVRDDGPPGLPDLLPARVESQLDAVGMSALKQFLAALES